jgi:hypothetical protein
MKSKIYHNKEILYSVSDDPNYFGKIDLEMEHKHLTIRNYFH